MANIKTELESKQQKLKDIKLTTNLLDAEDVTNVLDSIDNRLSDLTLTEDALDVDSDQLILLLGKIIEKFGGTSELNETQLVINITSQDIEAGTNVVSFITSPFVADPSKPIVIDWGDGTTQTIDPNA